MKRRLQALFGGDGRGPASAALRDRPADERRGKAFQPRGPRIGVAEAPLPPQERLGRRAPRTGARDRDPGDRARPSGFARSALGGTGDARLRRIEARRLSRRPRRPAGRGARFVRGPGFGLIAAGRGPERERILGEAAKTPTWWCVRAEAAPTDAEHVLRQSLALHRRAGALNRELKLAERSLADEPTSKISPDCWTSRRIWRTSRTPRRRSRVWRPVGAANVVDLSATAADRGEGRALAGERMNERRRRRSPGAGGDLTRRAGLADFRAAQRDLG